MVRAHIYILALSFFVLASACEKAKMRTVPRKQAAPTASAVPASAAPSEDYGPDDVNPKTPRTAAPQAGTPAPTEAPEPVKALEDNDEVRSERVPVAAPRRALSPSRDESIVDRPSTRRSGELPPALDGEEGPSPDSLYDDCEPGQKVVRPLPVRRQAPRPVIREEVVREQYEVFELDPNDELHCRWEPQTGPMTYLKYNPQANFALIEFGIPRKTLQIDNLRVVRGMYPNNPAGLSLITPKGVPVAHFLATGHGTLPMERGTIYPYESYFGQVPGAPRVEPHRGVCWTTLMPAQTSESNR